MAGATRTVRIRFTGETKGLVLSAKGAENAFERLQDKVVNGFGRATKGAAALATKVAAVGSAMSSAAAGGAALSTAAGALLAAPAALAGYATILGAVKLGQDGAARSAQRFAASISGVKDAVSASFEKALNPAADRAAVIVKALQGRLQGIVTELGGMATAAANTAALPQNLRVLDQVGRGATGMLANLRMAVPPLVQAFIDVVSVAVPGLDKVGSGAGRAAQRFADLVRHMRDTGELRERLDAGLAKLRELGAFLADLGGIVTGVFAGISAGAGGAGGAVGPLLDQLNAFIHSTQGQELLQGIGAAMAKIGDAISRVLMPALRAVSPLVGPLAKFFADVTSAVADLIEPLIDFLTPALRALADVLERNESWLVPVAVGLGIVTGAVWLFNAALAANPITLIIIGIGLLVAAVIWLADNWSTVWGGIKDVAGKVADWVTDKWHKLMSFFEGIPGFFARIGQGIADGIKAGFKAAVNFIVDLLNTAIGAVNRLIDGMGRLSSVAGIPGLPHIPSIPRLAHGGQLTRGGLAMVGERGRELVSLPAGAQVHSNRDTEAMLGGGGIEVRVFIGDQELKGLVRTEISESNRGLRRSVLAGAGGAR